MDNTDEVYSATASEIRAFVERYEALESEKKEVAEAQKEVMAEATGRGYCAKTLKKIVALRKKDSDTIAEEEAVEEIYREALGI